MTGLVDMVFMVTDARLQAPFLGADGRSSQYDYLSAADGISKLGLCLVRSG